MHGVTDTHRAFGQPGLAALYSSALSAQAGSGTAFVCLPRAALAAPMRPKHSTLHCTRLTATRTAPAAAMRPEQLAKLRDNLPREAHKVLLAPERFKFDSFELSLNYETISAADHCMAITALLARAEAASTSDAFWWVDCRAVHVLLGCGGWCTCMAWRSAL